MSFALTVKREVSKLPLKEKCCVLAELLGVICFGGTIKNNCLTVKTESAAIARRIFLLTKECFGVSPVIHTKEGRSGSIHTVIVAPEELLPTVLEELRLVKNSHDLKNFISYRLDPELVERDCCKRAVMRGAFLVSGSCMAPDKTYHLEVTTNHLKLSRDFLKILDYFEIPGKMIIRKSNYVIYLKGSEKIFDFLGNIGASNSMLEFQNVRIIKEVKNNINRMINCESSNLNKTLSASFNQASAIEKIDRTIGIESLEPGLREIARLRLENKDVTLKELGQMLKHPISKSGVNHRLKKLEEIASGLEEKKGR